MAEVLVLTTRPTLIGRFTREGESYLLQNTDAANDCYIADRPEPLMNTQPGSAPPGGVLLAHGGGTILWPSYKGREVWGRAVNAAVIVERMP